MIVNVVVPVIELIRVFLGKISNESAIYCSTTKVPVISELLIVIVVLCGIQVKAEEPLKDKLLIAVPFLVAEILKSVPSITSMI